MRFSRITTDLGRAAGYLKCFCIVAAITVVDMSVVPLEILSQSVHPQAKCLDGTPGGFYHQRALDPDSKAKWVIHMQGQSHGLPCIVFEFSEKDPVLFTGFVCEVVSLRFLHAGVYSHQKCGTMSRL